MSDAIQIAVYCEICGHHLAYADVDVLALPLKGSMFQSPMPGQLEAPFPPEIDWEDMFCPLCRKRPFTRDDRIKTQGGMLDVAQLVRNRQAKASPPPPESRLTARIASLFEQGLKPGEIGKALGIPHQRVNLILRREGLM